MKIKKRDGSLENLSFDKIVYRLKKLKNEKTLGVLSTIDVDVIAQKVVSTIYDGVSSSELDEEAARITIAMTENLEFGKMAARLVISNSHKNTTECFSEVMENLYNNVDKNGKHAPILSDSFIEIVRKNKDILNEVIDYKRDYLFDYFGYKTLEKSYLMKIHGKVAERPQHLYLRICIQLHQDDLENIIKMYELLSNHIVSMASPIIFNSGARLPNLASCYLLGTNDSVGGIFKTLSDVAHISKVGGGIGIHINNIRSKGAIIRGTNGNSDGIIPMLKVYNETCKFINQCFTPDTWVYSKSGPKQMEKITTDDELITIDGTFKKVNEVIKSTVDKEIMEIRATNTLFPVKVTKEHELYLIKGQKKISNYSLIKKRLEEKIIQPEFSIAGELTEDDIVGFPIPKLIQDNDIQDLDYYKMYGMMLGDGHISKNRNEYCITLSDYTKLDLQIFTKAFLSNKSIHYWISKQNGCTQICWSGSDAFKLTRDMLYAEDGQKIIIDSYLHLPKDKTEKLLEGLLRTDGSNLKELAFTSSSQRLIMQMRYLFLRLGVLTSGCVKDIGKSHITKAGRTITTKQISYYLRIPRHPNLENIIKLKNKGKFFKYFEWNGMLWGRIKSINKVNYSGEVYDFNMIDNHNYLTDMGLVHNSGRRKGSFAIYLSPEHPDIMEFLDLRKNQGSEDMRARDLFLAMWLSDEFMQQVEKDGDWYLMDPDECPGLPEAYGEDFKKLYWRYVDEKRYRKKVKAQEIWMKILESNMETGTPYLLNKDQINLKSNQSNIGTVKSSNLCTEICIVSDDKQYGVCNLCSVAIPKFVEYDKDNKPFFNHEKLFEITKQMMLPMNNVIDYNFYPVPEAELGNKSARPIGVGVQGLSDTYIMMRYPFESESAKKLNKEIFETIYFGCLTGSMELAKKDGKYNTFEGSPFSQGKLQFDMWAETNGLDLKDYLSGRWDWESLRKNIIEFGTRNSLLTCIMPTAGSAQIMGNTEACEPFDSCIFKRRVLSGEYMIVNKHLVKDLTKLKLWNKELKDTIIANNGSIQNIDNIPEDIKELYKTVWEISMKNLIDQSSDRGPFIDQSQSLNLFIATPTVKKITSMYFYAYKKGLKTLQYYLRSKSAVNSGKFTIDSNLEKKIKEKQKTGKPLNKKEEEAVLMCSIDNKEDCELCSA